VSCSYLASDFLIPEFAAIAHALKRAGDDKMPRLRVWEHMMAAAFSGVVKYRIILDVGTRESILPSFFADAGAYVVATDVDTSKTIEHQNVSVQTADARQLPYGNDHFDLVISTACIKLIDDDTQAVKEMFRVLKPHGRMAITFDFGQDYAEFPSEATGRRIYDKQSIYERLIWPLGSTAHLCGPANFERSDWLDWPIAEQAPTVFAKGVNVQTAFVLIRKIPGSI
jgi:SAM-dependent methyltransferase